MTDVKDNSSLPLLLGITGAVLAVVAGGWFFLVQQSRAPDSDPAAAGYSVTSIEGSASEESETGSGPAVGAATPVDTVEEAAINVDVELRKARLAADAEIFVLPPSHSALYYYGRVLRAEPQHAIAAAELDAILARVSKDVSEYLENEDYESAYEIAVLVAQHVPEHELVLETQRVLDEYTEQLVEQAIQLAQDGADNDAMEALASVESLPGRNPEYIAAVRDSMNEIRDVRVAAERDRAQRAKLADGAAKAAWLKQTRAAIGEGNLIAPAGASARDLLAEKNSWAAEREQLTGELLAALLGTAQTHIDNTELDAAEVLVDAAAELDAEAEGLTEIRAVLEDAFVAAQSRRVVSTRELVSVKTVPPRYPRRASDRAITGYVIVEFTVTTDGKTGEIEVRQSEPERIFNKAAIDAVQQWAFEPVVYRGRTINQRAAARLSFTLE
jgi:TonB family protein